MKFLLLTPTYFPLCTGNAVTVNRIARLLSQRKIQSDIVNLAQIPPKALPESVRQSAPDLLHAFHALKAGIQGLELHERFGIPLITTLSGTDINLDLADPERRRIMMEVLHGSATPTFDSCSHVFVFGLM